MSSRKIPWVRAACLVVGLGWATASTSALAEEPTAAVRRDPNGIKGISPYWEAIKAGDNAYVAQDYPGAAAAFRQAIELMPQNALGHYRLGQALLASGDATAAEQAYSAALRYASDPTMKAKVAFVLADLRERQRDLAGATQAWTDYATLAAAKDARAYPATAEARRTAIAKWQETAAAYAKVKERIAARESEADKSLQRSAR
jgi:tetratricopeptide (TPR) repeat protein